MLKTYLGSGLLLLAAAATSAIAAEARKAPNDSVVNSGFQQPLENGWEQSSRDYVGFHDVATLKDGGVKVTKTMCGRVELAQAVKLPETNTLFSTRVNLRSEATGPGYYSYAAVVVSYLDSAGKQLGSTRLVSSAGNLPWKNSGALHLMPAANPGEWFDWSFNIGQELRDNLKSVPAGKIKAVKVGLESFGSGTDAC